MSKNSSEGREVSRILIPSIFFILGIFFAFFLTHKDILSQSNWKILVIVRIIWQLGGAIWIGLAITTFFSTYKRKTINVFAFLFLGILLSFNALVDFIRGPIILTGTFIKQTTEKTFIPSSGYSMGTEQDISVIYFRDSNGIKYELEINTGYGEKIKSDLKLCDGNKIELVYLNRLDAIIMYRCK